MATPTLPVNRSSVCAFFVSYADWPPDALPFVSHASASDSSGASLISMALPPPPSLPINSQLAPSAPKPTTISEILARRAAERRAAQAQEHDAPTTTMSDAAPPALLNQAAKRTRRKKHGGQSTVRFASNVKPPSRADGSPSRKPRATSSGAGNEGNSEGGRERPALDPISSLRVDTADKQAWVAEQAALTHALYISYGKAGRGITARGGGAKKGHRTNHGGEYVPKPRKTQRAKQRRPLEPHQVRQRHMMGIERA